MSGFNFGSGSIGSTNAGGGFSFGAAASTPAAAGTGGFTLGGALGATAPASTTTTSSLGLGGSLFSQKPTGGFSFNTPASGAPAASTAPTTGFSMTFNKPSASAQPFSLTAASSAPTGAGLTLGSVLTSTAPQQGATGFSLNLGGVAASTAPSTGLSLGSSMFSNMATTGLSQSTLGGLGFALGLGQTTLGSGGLTLGSLASTSTAVSAAPSLGLGGVDFSTSSEKKSDKSSGASPQDSKALKDENLPPVICQDVDNFQKFVKEQKQVHEEISRMSSKAMLKVQDDIKSLKQLLSVSASGLQRNALAIDKLKMETAQELKNADIALRTQKTPPGLQHDNTAPYDYFRCLVEQFEVQLQQYRQQIEELENHLTTQGSGSHITPQDLSLAMQKLYQTFVALAAQLQSVHENVKTLKQQYLGYRRAFLEDSTDVFESKRVASKKWQSAPRITTGPAPFSSIPNAAAVAMAATLSQQQQPGPVFGGGPGFGGVATGGSSFGFSSASKPSGGSLSAGFGSNSSSGFNFSSPGLNASAGLTFGVSNPPATGFGTGGPLLQLKKPPVGNKRGKR
ncbi:nucleoporin p58/p45 isoform X3 [Oncorhynchus nerka]|uniref:Nucleoporin 58 n=1 Tax=Oncorhynchus mykiss TaxID=8022 RepID=A0A8C7QNY6_ONCMY|nr:nucleoporin p58/p45 isoform X3 [Oncorhynchus mykiss]XP_024262014.1 nucleoporin p58/p45 isoform X3 [Oncorhynchus tshawytscha]XP_029482382.1 nucleoporin p58/p45 isoform X3 [Oncorhynchus nerka]